MATKKTPTPAEQPEDNPKIDISIGTEGSTISDSDISIGDITGRDKIDNGDDVHGDKVLGNKFVIYEAPKPDTSHPRQGRASGELASYPRLAESNFIIPTSDSAFINWLQIKYVKEAGIGIIPSLKYYAHAHLDQLVTAGVLGTHEFAVRRDIFDGENWIRVPLVSINVISHSNRPDNAQCEVWVARLQHNGTIKEEPAEFLLWNIANAEYDQLVTAIQIPWPKTIVKSFDNRNDEMHAWGGRLPRVLSTVTSEQESEVTANDGLPAPSQPSTSINKDFDFVSLLHLLRSFIYSWWKQIAIGISVLLTLIGLWADVLSIRSSLWPLSIPTPITASPSTTQTIATPTPNPEAFSYGVSVYGSDNKLIRNAQVRIEIEGKAPLDEYTDINGYARVFIPAELVQRAARLSVEADGYEVHSQNIDLWPDRLPDRVQLEPK